MNNMAEEKDETITGDEDAEEETPEYSEEEQTSDEKTEGDEEKKEGKGRRSEIAQKKHWRSKAQRSSAKVAELEAELVKLREAVKKPDDEKEAAAQKYIRDQARSVYQELQKEREKEEAKELASFEGKIDDILEDNPDISEEELLDAVEEYEVEPEVALKILKRPGQSKTKEKPKMPTPKRGSSESKKETPDDSRKSIWQIAQEEIHKLKQ